MKLQFCQNITVEDVMTKKLKTVSPDLTVSELLNFMAKYHYTGYPVVDEKGDFVGVVTLQEAAKIDKVNRDEIHVRDIVQADPVVCYPKERALEAFKKMRTYKIARIAVVDEANPKKILGLLTKTDLRHILSGRS